MPRVRYIHNPVTRTMDKVTDRVLMPTSQEYDDMPFSKKILQGYKNAEAKGQFRSAWRPERVKEIWGNQ